MITRTPILTASRTRKVFVIASVIAPGTNFGKIPKRHGNDGNTKTNEVNVFLWFSLGVQHKTVTVYD